MKSFYLTDAGRVRSHNEDSVTILSNNRNEYIMIVADGMGGHRAGEIASSMVVTHLGKRFNELSSLGSKLDAINWLRDNLNEVNKEIIEYTVTNPESTGMGTTAVIAILTSEYLIFGNIGDSSGFVIKNEHLHKVTKDHTLVNLMVESGDITPEEAEFHPKKNILLKALGAGEKAEIDIFDVDMESEAILLCSDGLTNMLTKDQIEHVLLDKTLDINEKVIKLVRKSNARGGLDNVSVAYLEIESGEQE